MQRWPCLIHNGILEILILLIKLKSFISKIINIDILIKQSSKGYYCESGIAIFAWRVKWNYAYSHFKSNLNLKRPCFKIEIKSLLFIFHIFQKKNLFTSSHLNDFPFKLFLIIHLHIFYLLFTTLSTASTTVSGRGPVNPRHSLVIIVNIIKSQYIHYFSS